MFSLKRIILLLLFFILLPLMTVVQAAALKFDNTTATAASGATFKVGVMVDPVSDSLSSADVYITYDPALVKATSVTAGTQFPTVTNDITTSGKIYIAGMVNDPASSITTLGTLATVTFQALKDGSGTLAFDCNLSKIIKNDLNATNVISCAQNGTSAITIGAGGTTNPTATPAPGSDTPTAAPEELPQSGVFDNVVKFLIPGAILLILGSALRLVL